MKLLSFLCLTAATVFAPAAWADDDTPCSYTLFTTNESGTVVYDATTMATNSDSPWGFYRYSYGDGSYLKFDKHDTNGKHTSCSSWYKSNGEYLFIADNGSVHPMTNESPAIMFTAQQDGIYHVQATIYRPDPNTKVENPLYLCSRFIYSDDPLVNGKIYCDPLHFTQNIQYGSVRYDGESGKKPVNMDYYVNLKTGDHITFEVEAHTSNANASAGSSYTQLSVCKTEAAGEPLHDPYGSNRLDGLQATLDDINKKFDDLDSESSEDPTMSLDATARTTLNDHITTAQGYIAAPSVPTNTQIRECIDDLNAAYDALLDSRRYEITITGTYAIRVNNTYKYITQKEALNNYYCANTLDYDGVMTDLDKTKKSITDYCWTFTFQQSDDYTGTFVTNARGWMTKDGYIQTGTPDTKHTLHFYTKTRGSNVFAIQNKDNKWWKSDGFDWKSNHNYIHTSNSPQYDFILSDVSLQDYAELDAQIDAGNTLKETTEPCVPTRKTDCQTAITAAETAKASPNNAEQIHLSLVNLTQAINALQTSIDNIAARTTVFTTRSGDATYLVADPGCSDKSVWSGANLVNNKETWRGEERNAYVERTNSGNITQTIKDMPAGTYKLVAAVRGDTGTKKRMMINDTQSDEYEGRGNRATEGNDEINKQGIEMPYSSANSSLFTPYTTGHPWQWASVTVTISEPSDLIIGCYCDGNKWNAMDDIHLYYMSDLSGNTYCVTLDYDNAIDVSGKTVTCDLRANTPEPTFTASAMTIKDGAQDFALVTDVQAPQVTYTRTFEADQISTMCLPFDMTASQLEEAGLTAWAFNEYDAEKCELNFTQVTSTLAGRPYVVRRNADGEIGTITPETGSAITIKAATTDVEQSAMVFKGSYTNLTLISGAKTYYGYAATGTYAGQFVKVGSDKGAKLKPFRAYFEMDTPPAAASIRMRLNSFADDDLTVSVCAPEAAQHAAIYDLSGRKVPGDKASSPKKGIYITNGKKIMY